MQPAPIRKIPVAFAVAVTLSACSSGEPPTIDPQRVRSLVLQGRDLPEGFTLFDEGPGGSAGRPLGQDEPAGRATWTARFRRVDPSVRRGPLVVVSTAHVPSDITAADRRLDALRDEEGDGDVVDVPAIGDETWALTLVHAAEPRRVRSFVIAWRDGNVVASVRIQGFDGLVDVDDAVELARTQAATIRRARSASG